MTDALRITLPWGCLVSDNLRKGLAKEAWRRYKAGRDAAHMVALSQVRGERPRFRCPVNVELLFWLPDERKRDPSNLLKAVLDALKAVAYDDDSRVRSLSFLVMGVDKDNPRVEITVTDRATNPGWARNP